MEHLLMDMAPTAVNNGEKKKTSSCRGEKINLFLILASMVSETCNQTPPSLT
jgi:hypothetical protein